MSAIAAMRPGTTTDFTQLEPGFRDPVRGSQTCFRAVLDAMAHPGRIVAVPALLAGGAPAPLGVAATAVALTLCDIDTPIWLDEASSAVGPYIAFHCGAPIAHSVGDAAFALIRDLEAMPSLDQFALGSDEYPERSATLVIEVPALDESGPVVLRGPGIRGDARLDVGGLLERFWAERAALAELFPRGIDILFVCGNRLAALPRSTQIIR